MEIERVTELVDSAIRKCYEPTDHAQAEGTQMLNGQWLMPIWGCDTLDHLRDILIGVLAYPAQTQRLQDED